MKLHTERIYIRTLTLADCKAMKTLREENRTFLEPFEPAQTDESFTLGAVRQTIEQYIADQEKGTSFSFGIFSAAGDELLGRLRLTSIVGGAWHNANIGYFLAERANGQGLMTEAFELALRFAFEQVDLHRVQAAIMPRNLGSVRVAQKNGMRLEGVAARYLKINGEWEDHAIYALTAEEWFGNKA